MGNGNSREAKESRRSKLRQKLQKFRIHRRHLRCSRNSAGMVIQRAVSAEDFSGIALLTLIGADMKFKDKWLACVSFGEQTFRTEISDTTEKPIWNSEKKLLLEKNGPSLARVSVFETNRLSRNKIIGYCELDIFDFAVQEPESACKSFDLLDPTASNVVGTIFLSCAIEDPVETERRFAKRILSIVVIDRKSKRLVEELIDSKIVLSMRAIYQSKIGLRLMDQGAKEILQRLSEKQGKKMSSVESAQKIPRFLEFFKDQINMAEVKYPLQHFKTFNEFFIRELKPGARPIACMKGDDVAVCAADCRLMAFQSVEDSTRFWIKGKKFSIRGLLGKSTVNTNAFLDGSLVIFRLAPQDYHRFHVPVSGVIEKFVDLSGSLYTVNPIAVNSKYCNVFTENKRTVAIISTAEFGKVAFVAIGATMVGSINFERKEGEHVKKGDELGYFSFGGSTVICVFEKDSIRIDEDLLVNSGRSLETLVSVGMQLGVSTRTFARSTLT
ncbi:phosphatidylserine decarboxylase proenzyme 2 [Arabidopsis lyrata subsp. lyrata]|uniref:phosphatidylserine decarboxylase proenzyme 2 n=1 Tax=Arabidopsis lyrata subsp. lyrata TaxID=81972 RepID=UPI000A29DBE2|nr:phosphatidylserine decarboxylase proenzyme 2 [Arabidopsis lyrata subsp. lyrata]|eukprot:XP_020872759.1 phosphatidylserine decarboxylase proenzyme 2 [Arabidopsis lyrata subsp. lyrata]